MRSKEVFRVNCIVMHEKCKECIFIQCCQSFLIVFLFFFSINTVLTQFTCVPLFQCYPFVKWYMVFCSEVSQKYILARGTARWKQATPSGSKQQLQVEVGPLTVLIAHFSGPKFPFAVLRAQSC